MWRWLPFFVGGFCGPLLGNLFEQVAPAALRSGRRVLYHVAYRGFDLQ